MFCMHCGKEIPENAEFCPACGTRIQTAPPHVTWSDLLMPVGILVVLGAFLLSSDAASDFVSNMQLAGEGIKILFSETPSYKSVISDAQKNRLELKQQAGETTAEYMARLREIKEPAEEVADSVGDPESSAGKPTRIPDDRKAMIAESIEQEPEVIDAHVAQKTGDLRKVTLAIIVRAGTSERRAKELGDNFVRLFKTLSDDDSPGKEIGRGKYDYLVGIYDRRQNNIAMGAKIDIATSISW